MNGTAEVHGTSQSKKTRPVRVARPGQALLTLAQSEAEYGIPRTSQLDLIARGHLPAVRLPGEDGRDARRVWIRRVDMEALIARSTATAV